MSESKRRKISEIPLLETQVCYPPSVVQVHVKVLQVYEGNVYLIGDESCAYRLKVPSTFTETFHQYEKLVLNVELQKKWFFFHSVDRDITCNNQSVLESCGIIMYAKDTKKMLMVRNYHSRNFIDAQFKMKAAFTGTFSEFPIQQIVANIATWSDDEVLWVLEWNLKQIYPYITDEMIRSWKPTMIKLDKQIKEFYRLVKEENTRRRKEHIRVENKSWSFPKGGVKVVGREFERYVDAARREVVEEIGYDIPTRLLERCKVFDIPRDHKESFDRFYLFTFDKELPMKPANWDVSKAEWMTMEEIGKIDGFKGCTELFEYLKEMDTNENTNENKTN